MGIFPNDLNRRAEDAHRDLQAIRFVLEQQLVTLEKLVDLLSKEN